MSWMRIAAVSFASITLGCGSTAINAFDESAIDSASTAIVRVAPNLVVNTVDGNPKWKGSSTSGRPLVIRVPPGAHTVNLHFRQDGANDQKIAVEFTTTESDPVDFEIHVRSGRQYSIGHRDIGNGWRPTFRETGPTE